MKNLKLFLLLPFILFASCKKNKKPDDCGCDAPIRTTIPDSANLIGSISFYSNHSSKDFKNKYVIIYTEQDCLNCVHYMAICNTTILPQSILDIKATNQTLQVKFAGHLRPICDNIFAPADYTYEHITLTKIEKIEGQ